MERRESALFWLLCLVILLWQSAAGAERSRRWAKQSKPDRVERLAGLDVAVWLPAQPVPAPLVLFSHGYRGCNTQSTFLMKGLAGAGYLVVSPNHRDASCTGLRNQPERPGFGRPETWTEENFKDRGEDLKKVLSALRSDERYSRLVDWDRIALAGHSLGGYTAMAAAGAWPSWRIGGVKAVLALSPYCAPFAQKGTLTKLRVPVMFQTGTRDLGIAQSIKRKDGAYEQMPGPAYLVELKQAGHFAWTDLQAGFQESILRYALAFLNEHVKGQLSRDLVNQLPDAADFRSK